MVYVSMANVLQTHAKESLAHMGLVIWENVLIDYVWALPVVMGNVEKESALLILVETNSVRTDFASMENV